MPISDYSHHGEDAPIIWAAENDFDSPYADMTDDEIKQRVYDRFNDPDFDMDHDEW